MGKLILIVVVVAIVYFAYTYVRLWLKHTDEAAQNVDLYTSPEFDISVFLDEMQQNQMSAKSKYTTGTYQTSGTITEMRGEITNRAGTDIIDCQFWLSDPADDGSQILCKYDAISPKPLMIEIMNSVSVGDTLRVWGKFDDQCKVFNVMRVGV